MTMSTLGRRPRTGPGSPATPRRTSPSHPHLGEPPKAPPAPLYRLREAALGLPRHQAVPDARPNQRGDVLRPPDGGDLVGQAEAGAKALQAAKALLDGGGGGRPLAER